MKLLRYVCVSILIALVVSACNQIRQPTPESSPTLSTTAITASFQGLGGLSGENSYSQAHDVSADGLVVVGRSISGNGNEPSGFEAFRWSESDGMRSIKDVLVNDYHLDLTGWELISAQGISTDGRIVVGLGRNPSGLLEAWRAVW